MQAICYYGLITATFFILIKKHTVVLYGEKLTVGTFFFLEHENFAHCQKNYFVIKKMKVQTLTQHSRVQH